MRRTTVLRGAAAIAALAVGIMIPPSPAGATLFSFARTDWTHVGGGVGSVRAGDVDNDGDVDIVGVGGNNIYIFANGGSGGWTRFGDLDSTGDSGLNGSELFDVDGDGHLDIVGARYKSDLGWWENPGGPLTNAKWSFHPFATDFPGWYLHDMIRADLDGDGQSNEFICVLQSGYWDAPVHIYWFRPGSDPFGSWEKHAVTHGQAGPSNNHAGIDAADMDGDGDIDISFCNGWFESPGRPAGSWTWHKVTDIYGISNSLTRDVDGDGDQDLILSGGHHGQGIFWFENTGGPFPGPWTRRDISAVRGDVFSRHRYSPPEDGQDHIHHPEGLQAADLDGDGDVDVLASELFFGEDPGEPRWDEQKHNLYIYENLGGTPPRWKRQNISPNSWPSHLPSLVDVDEDGRLDVITEGPHINNISYLRNKTVTPDADVKANGLDGPITITRETTLSVTIELRVDGNGSSADWWLAVKTPFPPPFDWYHYERGRGWAPGLEVTFQGPCVDLGPLQVLSMTGLPVGAYTFFFGVDLVRDGLPSRGTLSYDRVRVRVIP